MPRRRLSALAATAWDEAVALGEAHGYRNAQATVIAPTGTIGLVMDCDTTGIEPDFALVKFKKLAGGGYFKIINRSVPAALRTLGYRESPDRGDRQSHAVGHGSLGNAPGHQPHVADRPWLRARRRSRRSRRRCPRPSTSASSSTSGRWAADFLTGNAGDPGGQAVGPGLRPAAPSGLLARRYRRGQRSCLRDHDAGRARRI